MLTTDNAGANGRQLITRARRQAGRIAAVLALALLVTGCSAIKLGYENLPRLVQWQADRYLSLDTDQEALVNRHAKALQRWHRQNLLPVYAEFLREVEEEVHSPVTPGQVAGWRRTVVSAWAPLAEQLAPAVAEVAVTLRPAQLARLRDELAKSNEKAAKRYRAIDPAERQEARYQRLVERAESFLGDVNDAQKQLMREAAAAMASNEDAWWQTRLARQEAILALLEGLAKEKPEAAVATRRTRLALASLFSHHGPAPTALKPTALKESAASGSAMPESAMSESASREPAMPESAEHRALRRDIAAASAEGDDLAAGVLALATPQQRHHLSKRLGGYREDFRLLAVR